MRKRVFKFFIRNCNFLELRVQFPKKKKKKKKLKKLKLHRNLSPGTINLTATSCTSSLSKKIFLG